jgi:hypothetical protein
LGDECFADVAFVSEVSKCGGEDQHGEAGDHRDTGGFFPHGRDGREPWGWSCGVGGCDRDLEFDLGNVRDDLMRVGVAHLGGFRGGALDDRIEARIAMGDM